MPAPLALCLEDLTATERSRRYLRCVALVGRQPGLRLSAEGGPLWRSPRAAACELWVSADDRLIVYRPAGAPPLVLRRAGRRLDVPEAKPVVALDQDQLDIGPRRLRVHVHGKANAIAAPSPLPERARSGAARMAAVVAVGAAVAGCQKPIEVRDAPPEPPIEPGAGAPPDPGLSPSATTTAAQPEGEPEGSATSQPRTDPSTSGAAPEPIEVREDPPDMVMDE